MERDALIIYISCEAKMRTDKPEHLSCYYYSYSFLEPLQTHPYLAELADYNRSQDNIFMKNVEYDSHRNL